MYTMTVNPRVARRHQQNCVSNDLQHQLRSELVEHDKGWSISLDLPGLSQEEIEVLIEQGDLVIRGERKQPDREGQRILNSTRLFGSFEKRYRMTEEIDASSIRAEMQSGVLTVHLDRAPESRPRRVEISVN